ncbi:T9SS type A sorting domain-containing protein, partial [candidate division KSB1 bacterium]|nr:T9SS type A sorting domain-containing protein [candidate division KSB1 bacterium]
VVENPAIQYAATVTSIDANLNEGCVFRTENGGESWDRLGGLEACWSLSCLHQISEEVLLAGGLALTEEGPRGAIYRSENRGQRWDPVLWFPDGVVTDIMQTRDGRLYAATGWNGLIFKSDDMGHEWSPIAELGERIHIYCLMQDAHGDLFAGIVRDGDVGQILFSEDGGEEWAAAEGLERVTAVYDLLDTDDKMYAGVSGMDMGWVYQSTTRGRTWSKTAELINTEVRAVHCLLEYVPENSNIPILLAGTEMNRGPSFTQVYAKQQNQSNWQLFAGSIDMANAVYTLAKTPHKILAGTGFMFGNIYAYDIEQKNGVGNQNNYLIPQTFDLTQNYPNPFNSKTEIAYQLPEASDIEISIYNLQGQKVATLVQKKQHAGYYKLSWDGLDDKHQAIASGLYFCRMLAGDYVNVIRMILLK